jgi:hypothetical protein
MCDDPGVNASRASSGAMRYICATAQIQGMRRLLRVGNRQLAR